MEETQPASAGDTTPITIEYLRRFPKLGKFTDEQVQRFVGILLAECIETVGELAESSRETLVAIKLPARVVDVLIPIQQSTQSESATRELLKQGRENREDFRKFKKQILEMQMAESKAVSYVEYYNDKVGEGRVEQWNPAESLDVDQLQLPDYLQLAHNHIGAETKTVHPFWKDALQNHKVISSLQNGFEVAHLGTKIPDIAFYREGIAIPGAADFVAAGDCKGSTWTGTSSSELGQMMLYLHRMFDAQPVRKMGYGFVTNNRIIVLVKAYRSNTSPFLVRWCISNVFDFDHGMKIWLQMMQEDTGYSKPPIVGGFPVSVQNALRPGGTCRTFTATYRGEEVVAKLYYSANLARDSAARTARAGEATTGATTDSNALARIPRVVATEECWSLITPKGQPMTMDRLTKTHVQRLVSTLQIIHAAGIIHRDVRMSNIFYLTDEDVLLNDWGSSVEANESTLYAGSPEPLIYPEIPLNELYAPLPKHDLYSLVSSVAQFLSSGNNIESRRELYAEAFQSAEACNYEGVKRGIVKRMRG